MTTDEQLKTLLSPGNRLGENTFPAVLRWVKVLSVDAGEKTMDVQGISDELEYFGIELGAGSVILYPTIDTLCLIGMVEGLETNGFLISATKVDKIEVTASTEIILNGGTLGGLVKVEELTDAVNAMVDTFNKHTHSIAGVQLGSGSVTSVKTQSEMQKLNRSKIENDKVKQ